MISRDEISEILARYDLSELTIATLGSHSALQIFHGARQEGFRTLNICTEERRGTYEAFPLSKADEFLIVQEFKDVLNTDIQQKLIAQNAVVIPHGSFVEYVNAEHILGKFAVPMFGNRESLRWETDRQKQRQWLESAGLKMPKEYRDPSEIDSRVLVKLPGAKGGRGYFSAASEEEFRSKLSDRIRNGILRSEDPARLTIQEFVAGVRYYPHFFASLIATHGTPFNGGSVELLSMDKRIEPIDESYRGFPDNVEEYFDFTVTGNQPVVIRESLLPEILKMGARTAARSVELFKPGVVGPFSLETIYSPESGFWTFEISARVVAGTNLYPTGSPYSAYLYQEPMSTGRRIAREMKLAIAQNALEKVVF
jgi:5-formaminoimidazole-4-carboxamide-1-(beta)-D-ribofuranosyl 5'-monophosphate synthetase